MSTNRILSWFLSGFMLLAVVGTACADCGHITWSEESDSPLAGEDFRANNEHTKFCALGFPNLSQSEEGELRTCMGVSYPCGGFWLRIDITSYATDSEAQGVWNTFIGDEYIQKVLSNDFQSLVDSSTGYLLTMGGTYLYPETYDYGYLNLFALHRGCIVGISRTRISADVITPPLSTAQACWNEGFAFARDLIDTKCAGGNFSLGLTFPAGSSPKVFNKGWPFGASCIWNGVDLSSQVTWSGTGAFIPDVGNRTIASFNVIGKNQITLSIRIGESEYQKTFDIVSVHQDKYAKVGDLAFCPSDGHGAPGEPHSVIGPIIQGSPTVSISGVPAARKGDSGVHCACSGPNHFVIDDGDPEVLIDGKPAARIGDRTVHCGGIGNITQTGSSLSISSDNVELHVGSLDLGQTGGLWLDLTMADANQLIFEIINWGQANGLNPLPSTLNLNSGILNIPDLFVGNLTGDYRENSFLELDLIYLTGLRFRLNSMSIMGLSEFAAKALPVQN